MAAVLQHGNGKSSKSSSSKEAPRPSQKSFTGGIRSYQGADPKVHSFWKQLAFTIAPVGKGSILIES